MADALFEARTAFAGRRWEDAYALFAAADHEPAARTAKTGDANGEPAERLPLDDLGKYARSASLTARDREAFALLERGYERSLAADEDLIAADFAFWLGFRLFSLGEAGRAQAWLERVRDIADRHGDCVQQGYLLVPRIHRELLAHRNREALALVTEAVACGERHGDPDLVALARQLGGRALIEDGDVDAGIRMLDEAMLTATTAVTEELTRGLVYCAVLGCCERVFAVDRAREWAAVLGDWCDAQSQLGTFNGTCRVHRAELFRFAGEWDASLAEAGRVAAAATSDRHERAVAAYELAQVHRLRGDAAEAERWYAAAASAGVDPQPGLSLLRLAQGDIDAAVGGITRALATTSSALGRVRLLPAAVEILDAAGHHDRAAAAAEEIAAIADEFATPVLHAEAALATGRMLLSAGDPAAAVDPLTEALTGWDALGALHDGARTRILLAEAFATLGDADGARMQRDAALAVFDDLGALPDAQRLDAQRLDAQRLDTQHTGDPSARGTNTDPPRRILTPREEGVLRLAATGITNKQIAVRLGLSTRTVDRHVSNILAKLGVPSRAAATAYAYEHDLLRTPTG